MTCAATRHASEVLPTSARGGQERWQFTLLIGRKADAAEPIDWPSLLQAGDVTGWLSPHISERR